MSNPGLRNLKRAKDAMREDSPRRDRDFLKLMDYHIFYDDTLVVIYEHRSKEDFLPNKRHVSRRIITCRPDGRPRSSFIIESWFEDKDGKILD